MLNRYRSIVFDLDGTLIDSFGDVLSCLKRTAGGAVSFEAARTYMGLPLSEILRSAEPALDDKKLGKLCAKFREIYDVSDYPLTKLMPEVSNVLNTLSAYGVEMFVATNKPMKPTLRIMAKLKMTAWFKDVVTPDILAGGKMSKSEMLSFLINKWRLNKEMTIMVGDSDLDIAASKQNLVVSAYLTSGYGDTSKAELLRPDFILPGLSSLLEAVAGSSED